MENDLFSNYFKTVKSKPHTSNSNKENTRPSNKESPFPTEKSKKPANTILSITITESKLGSNKSSFMNSMLSSRRGSSTIINESSVVKEPEIERAPIEKRIEQLYLDLHNIDIKADEQLSRLTISKSKVKLAETPDSTAKKFKARSIPKYQAPFIVYKSTKPLTIPKEPNLTSRSKSREKVRPTVNPELTYEEKMNQIREKSKVKEKPIISKGSNTPNFKTSALLEKFKEFCSKEVNSIQKERNRSVTPRRIIF